MADLRISPQPARPPAATVPARSDAARAAQAAFFQTALARQDAPIAPSRAAANAPPPAEAATLRNEVSGKAKTPPDRILRPGSLVDIRV